MKTFFQIVAGRHFREFSAQLGKTYTTLLSILVCSQVGFLLAWFSPKIVVIGLAAGCAGLLFLMQPLKATMLFIAFQKVTDAFWFVKFNIAGFDVSLQRLLGTLFPFLGLSAVILYAARGHRFRLPLADAILLFVVFICFGIVRSPIPKEAVVDGLKAIGCFVFYYLGYLYFTHEERLRRFVRLYVLVGVFPIFTVLLQQVGLLNLQTWDSKQAQQVWIGGEYVARYAGIYNDAATMSIFLLVGLPLLFAVISEERNLFSQQAYIFLCACYVYALFVSWVRVVWVALYLQIMLWYLLGRSRRVFWTLLVASGLLVALNLNFFARVLDWSVVGSLQPEGLSGKIGYWIIVIRHFVSADWATKFLGGGLLMNEYILTNTRQAELGGKLYVLSEGWGGKAHSDFVEYLVDIGIVGLVVYIRLLVLTLRKMWFNLRQAEGLQVRLLSQAWLSIFSTYLLFGMLGWSSRYPSMTWPLWFLAGGLLGTDRRWACSVEVKSNAERSTDRRF